MTETLFQRLLGADFGNLPEPVRTLHSHEHAVEVQGECRTLPAETRLGGLLGRYFGLPAAGATIPFSVVITPSDDGEVWERNFGGRVFRSRLSECNGLLIERAGTVRMCFRLSPSRSGIEWKMVRFAPLGVPLPRTLWPRTLAREGADGAKYTFEVEAALPLLGRFAGYSGWLIPDR